MKTKILQINEPAFLAALAELQEQFPQASEVEVTVWLKQTKDRQNLNLPPTFQVGVMARPDGGAQYTEQVHGFNHDNLDFEKAVDALSKKYKGPKELLDQKRKELADLESQVANLESAVRS